MGCHTWFYSNESNFNKQLDCEYHDIFRHREYVVTLHNRDDTYAFIDKNKITLSAEQSIDLEKFWNKYPEAIIEFG